MAEDLSGNLRTYTLQLQQVEAALTTDAENEELHKLKNDLEEVIALTKELLDIQPGRDPLPSGSGESGEYLADNIFPIKPIRKWAVGDGCLAPWSKDRQFYQGVVESINNESGEVSVRFLAFNQVEVTTLVKLQETVGGVKKKSELVAQRKQQLIKQREYLKKRKAKKQQRFKQIEEEREKDKNKWLNFNNKSSGKRGVMKKSIFASPDNIQGRVGIGTCGIGGRPMTEYTTAEKWRKGT